MKTSALVDSFVVTGTQSLGFKGGVDVFQIGDYSTGAVVHSMHGGRVAVTEPLVHGPTAVLPGCGELFPASTHATLMVLA